MRSPALAPQAQTCGSPDSEWIWSQTNAACVWQLQSLLFPVLSELRLLAWLGSFMNIRPRRRFLLTKWKHRKFNRDFFSQFPEEEQSYPEALGNPNYGPVAGIKTYLTWALPEKHCILLYLSEDKYRENRTVWKCFGLRATFSIFHKWPGSILSAYRSSSCHCVQMMRLLSLVEFADSNCEYITIVWW
jgi:hypothetical protein